LTSSLQPIPFPGESSLILQQQIFKSLLMGATFDRFKFQDT
jgi:hypothetical protein